ncbi:uncharacterized protein LOC130797905 [Amaranthus tricolor]|uniref:uncharacterized protein LOC130797905 n=1 Tax=Amaranthus tricolor TaxID=29722 RepID=UPI00258FA584|nr:uncharacterized protein LOC130797905 [Amaranthus tricolor]
MALAVLRGGMAKNLKKMSPLLGRTQGIGTMTRTIPKMKAYAPAAEKDPSKGKETGNYVPIYVALGMIGLAVALGVHTAKQQFMYAPDVVLKKSRRETVPEVVEPERVAEESKDFIKNSLFRKVAHVQEFETPVDNPIHGNPLTREPRVESLKSVGVNPIEGNDKR